MQDSCPSRAPGAEVNCYERTVVPRENQEERRLVTKSRGAPPKWVGFQPVGQEILPRRRARPSKPSSYGSFVVIGLDRLCHPQPQVAEFLPKGLPGDSQQASGLVLVPTGIV
jgi:hypothetical protein